MNIVFTTVADLMSKLSDDVREFVHGVMWKRCEDEEFELASSLRY